MMRSWFCSSRRPNCPWWRSSALTQSWRGQFPYPSYAIQLQQALTVRGKLLGERGHAVLLFLLQSFLSVNCCCCMRCERYKHVDWFNIQEIEISDAEQSRYTRMTDFAGHLSSAVYRNQLRSTHTSGKQALSDMKTIVNQILGVPWQVPNFKNMRHFKPEQ